MKATKHILALAALTLSFSGLAKTFNKEQQMLRLDIVKQLTADGLKPNIDEDGDVSFTKNDIKYFVILNENWNNPFIYTIYSGFQYDREKDFSRENMEALISLINQNKTVKLYCDDGGYTLRTDVLCKDGTIFKPTFDAIIKQQEKARKEIVETITNGLGGLDLTGNKETIFERAMGYYQDEDYYKSYKLFKYLADEGYAPAYSFLGVSYQDGLGVTKDEDLMVENYEKAIDNGETWIAYNLADYYYGKRKYDKALELYTLCSGSDNAFRSDAYYMIGQINEKGRGIPVNLTKAIQCYKKSVEYSTELESNARLALIRLEQQVENPADFVDISKSLLVGLTPQEMFEKGYEYEHGLNNRTVSLPKAYGYYKASADKNYPQSFAKMGEIYISDFYPFKDKAKSDKYYEKAYKIFKQREGYDADAAYQLGMMFKEGRGVSKDQAQAITYFKNAAERGNTEANYELGLIYQGEMEPVDAFDCFMKAADKGLAKAMFEVAKAYETGMGTGRNREQAISWYTKCSETDTSIANEASAALKRLGKVDDEKE